MGIQLKIHNLSSLTMLIFGILAFVLGLIGILSPETTLQLVSFEIIPRDQRAAADFTLVFVIASSMASFNMGVYYILAAFSNMKAFYTWTVPFRCVTFVVFTLSAISGLAPSSFILIAAWELVGAVLTGLALVYERRKEHALAT